MKPVALMRWLIRLVTPPGGLVLDPFLGSGTTGIAAGLEGATFVGIEKDPAYLDLAAARIGWWMEHGEAALEADAAQERSRQEREAVADTGQLDLLAAE